MIYRKEGVTLKTSKLTDLAACNKTMLDKIKAHMEKLLQTGYRLIRYVLYIWNVQSLATSNI